MSVITHFTGFEAGAAVLHHEWRESGGSISISNAKSRTGSRSLLMNPFGTFAYVDLPLEFNDNSGQGDIRSRDVIQCSLWVNFSLGPMSEVPLIVFLKSETVRTQVTVLPGLTFRLDGVAAASPTALEVDSWHRIDLKADIITGVTELRIDRESEVTGTVLLDSDTIRFGQKAGAVTYQLNIDDVIIGASDASADLNGYWNDSGVYMFKPDANGAEQQWSKSGAHDAWDHLDEVPPNGDTDYILATGQLDSSFGVQNIGEVFTGRDMISAVRMIAFGTKDLTSAGDDRFAMKVNDGTTENVSPVFYSWDAYEGRARVFMQTPSAKPWKRSVFDGTSFGVRSVSGATGVRCTSILVEALIALAAAPSMHIGTPRADVEAAPTAAGAAEARADGSGLVSMESGAMPSGEGVAEPSSGGAGSVVAESAVRPTADGEAAAAPAQAVAAVRADNAAKVPSSATAQARREP